MHMSTCTFGRTAVALATGLMLAAGAVSAHTTIRSQATESVTDDNALKIGHGCETPDGSHIPVVAQSVVFPSSSPEIATSDGSLVSGLPAVIEQGTLAGLARAIQDKSVFRSQQVKSDTLGNAIGFSGTGGALNVDTPRPRSFPVRGAQVRRQQLRQAVAGQGGDRRRLPAWLGRRPTASKRVRSISGFPDNGSQYADAGQGAGHRWHRRTGYADDQPQRRHQSSARLVRRRHRRHGDAVGRRHHDQPAAIPGVWP